MEKRVENKDTIHNVANVPLDGSPVKEKNTRNDFQMNVVSSNSKEYMTRDMSSNSRPDINLDKRNGQVDDLDRVVDLQNLDGKTFLRCISFLITAHNGDDDHRSEFRNVYGENGLDSLLTHTLLFIYTHKIFLPNVKCSIETLSAAGFITTEYTRPGAESEVLNNIKNRAANSNSIKDEVENLLNNKKIMLLVKIASSHFSLDTNSKENPEKELIDTFELSKQEVIEHINKIMDTKQKLATIWAECPVLKKAEKIGVLSPISVESGNGDEDYQSDGNEDEQNRFNSDDDVAQDRCYPKDRVENDYDEGDRFNDRYDDTESYWSSSKQHNERNYHKNKTEHGRTQSQSKSSLDTDLNSTTGVIEAANEKCKELQKSYRPNENEKVNLVVKKGVGAAIMAQVLCREYVKDFQEFECVGEGGSVGRIDSIIASLLSYADSKYIYVTPKYRTIIKYSKKNRGELKNVTENQFINACIVGDAQRLIDHVNSPNGFNSDHLSIKECKFTSKSEKSLDQISKSLEGEAKKVLFIINESRKEFDPSKKDSFYKMVSSKYFKDNGNKATSVPQQPQKKGGIMGMMNRSDGGSTPDTHRQSGTNNVRSDNHGHNHHQSKPANTHPAPQSRVQRVANGKPNRGTPDARRQPNSNNVRNNNDSHNHHQSKPANTRPAQQPQKKGGIMGMMNR